MGAEIGATTSVFPFNSRMEDYLHATKRGDIAKYARSFAHNLKPDEGCEYDQVIDIVRAQKSPFMISSYTCHRTSRNSNPTSTAPSLRISLRLSPSSRRRRRRTTGLMMSRSLSSVHAPTLLTRICLALLPSLVKPPSTDSRLRASSPSPPDLSKFVLPLREMDRSVPLRLSADWSWPTLADPALANGTGKT